MGHEPSEAVRAVHGTLTALRRWTPARIALGRTGSSLPTQEVLTFSAAHAQARDAVHAALDVDALCQALSRQAWPDVVLVHSRVRDRHEYLLRPDLGRRLDEASRERLLQSRPQRAAADLIFVIGDGLSALGIQQHAVPLLDAIRTALDPGLALGPVVVARQARVALGDEIGELLGARMVAVLIGERPGLSSPDSVGIYLTLGPRVGCVDAQRNCISNVRPQGQDLPTAARRLAWLISEALRIGKTGVELKDHSGLPLIDSTRSPAALPDADDPARSTPAPPHPAAR